MGTECGAKRSVITIIQTTHLNKWIITQHIVKISFVVQCLWCLPLPFEFKNLGAYGSNEKFTVKYLNCNKAHAQLIYSDYLYA